MRQLLLGVLVVVCIFVSGDGVLAATCTPLAQGKCHACTKCTACKNCARGGGACSVCKRK